MDRQLDLIRKKLEGLDGAIADLLWRVEHLPDDTEGETKSKLSACVELLSILYSTNQQVHHLQKRAIQSLYRCKAMDREAPVGSAG